MFVQNRFVCNNPKIAYVFKIRVLQGFQQEIQAEEM